MKRLLAAIICATALPLFAADLPETLQVAGEQVELRGEGTYYWKRFFRVYSSALYLPAGATDHAAADAVPKRLVFVYARALSADQLRKAGDAILARNLTAEERATIAGTVGQINALYQDVGKGDSYTLTHLPGKGLELALNGESLGTIGDDRFANLYLRIWLGEAPVDAALRDQLLGLP